MSCQVWHFLYFVPCFVMLSNLTYKAFWGILYVSPQYVVFVPGLNIHTTNLNLTEKKTENCLLVCN